MHSLGAVLALVATVGVLIWAVTLRRKPSGEAGGVELADAAIALVPVIVWLVLTGQLHELTVGREEISVKLDAPVSPSVTPLQPESLEISGKPVDVDQMTQFINARKQAMLLVLGTKYSTQYFVNDIRNLIQFPFFRFVVFEKTGGEFFGMMEARELAAYMNQCDVPYPDQCQQGWQTTGGDRWSSFLKAVSAGDIRYDYFSKLPGFVGAANAIDKETLIMDVLEKMKVRNVDWLPVTRSDKLVGLANKSSVLAGLVLSLSSGSRE